MRSFHRPRKGWMGMNVSVCVFYAKKNDPKKPYASLLDKRAELPRLNENDDWKAWMASFSHWLFAHFGVGIWGDTKWMPRYRPSCSGGRKEKTAEREYVCVPLTRAHLKFAQMKMNLVHLSESARGISLSSTATDSGTLGMAVDTVLDSMYVFLI